MPMTAVAESRPPSGWLANPGTSIPVLPALAERLIQVVGAPDVSVMQIAQIVAKDPVLAGRLLGLANSAYCGAMRSVTTVAEAIIRVGTTGVRNLAVTICFSSKMYDPNIYGRHGRLLVDHAIGTAYLARLIAEHVGLPADEAFLYGLLHDIGKLVIRKQAYDWKRRTGTPVAEDEIESALDAHHAALGAHTLRRWHLPQSLDEPVMCHHDPRLAVLEPRKAAAACVANRLSHRYGFGCDADACNILGDAASRELLLDAEWLAQTDAHAPGLVDVARAFFDASA
jgi:putative nucleotidyltransferase with HDIG domain